MASDLPTDGYILPPILDIAQNTLCNFNLLFGELRDQMAYIFRPSQGLRDMILNLDEEFDSHE